MMTFLNHATKILGARLIYNRRGGRGGDSRGTEIPHDIENSQSPSEALKALASKIEDPRAKLVALNNAGLFEGPFASDKGNDYRNTRNEKYFQREGGIVENNPQQKV